jgi:hypothetical protein
MTLTAVSAGAEVISVPDQAPTIQAAIDRAQPGDTIRIASGDYWGHLVITKNLVLEGAGMYDPAERTGTQIIFSSDTEQITPLLHVVDATVTLRDLTITGGEERFTHVGTTPYGVRVRNANLTLQGVAFNRVSHYLVDQRGGDFAAQDVVIKPDTAYRNQTDIGLNLYEVRRAVIERLDDQSGTVDHSVNVNLRYGYEPWATNNFRERDLRWEPGGRRITERRPANAADRTELVVRDSTIRTSDAFWGDGIRIWQSADAQIENVTFYRESDEPLRDRTPHTGVAIHASTVSAVIRDCRFTEIPTAISIAIDPEDRGTGLSVLAERNEFVQSPVAAVSSAWAQGGAVDLGGGPLGSEGANRFVDNATDFRLYRQPADIWAEGNAFSQDVRIERQDASGVVHLGGVHPRISGSRVQMVLGTEAISTFDFGTDLVPRSVSAFRDAVYVHYVNTDGVHYVGRFSASLAYLGEYRLDGLEVVQIAAHDGFVAVYYRYPGGAEYLGSFDDQMQFLGEFVLGDVRDVVIESEGATEVTISYTSAADAYEAVFSREMELESWRGR